MSRKMDLQKERVIEGLKIKYLGCAGYEIITDRGTVFYVDPWLTNHAFHAPITVSDIKRADAILLTHAHGDHDEDVWTIMKNTGAMLLASQEELNVLNEIESLPTGQLQPVQWDDTVHIKGCEIHVTKAVHMSKIHFSQQFTGDLMSKLRPLGRSDRERQIRTEKMNILPKGYFITTETGLRIWILGPCSDPIPETAVYSATLRPQIAVVQVVPNLENAIGFGNAKMLFQKGVGPSIILPTHHDRMQEDIPIEADIGLFTTLVHQEFPEVKVINPELGRSYQFELQYR
jgi:L-ascorbate metabolism protein UlaG (beta-lactamase superfamily)